MRRPSLPLPAILALAIAAAPATADAATGGPDAFGYVWADDDEPGVDTSIPTTMGFPLNVVVGDETVSTPVSFGFAFPFYGANYTEFVVSDNGWISLDTSLTAARPDPVRLPAAGDPDLTIAWYWRDLPAPEIAQYFTFAGGGVLVLRTSLPGQSRPKIQAALIFYETGSLKIVYTSVVGAATASIGIENVDGSDGLAPWHLGDGENGFALESERAIQYFPSPSLACGGATVIDCGETLTAMSPAVVSPNVGGYLCSRDAYLGNEAIFILDNPSLADVTVGLSNISAGVDLDVFLLSAGQCNEFACLAGGGDDLAGPFLEPGQYYIVVDGKAATDNGSFDLTVDCAPRSIVQPCQSPGDPRISGATSGLSAWDVYGCTGLLMDGAELIYEVPYTSPGNIRVDIQPDPGVELDLLVFGPDRFAPPTDCGAWIDSQSLLFDPPEGRYFFVVDGRSGGGQMASGGFTLQVTCDILLDCGAPAGELLCDQTTAGTTTGAVNQAELYSCTSEILTGGEVAYQFHVDTPGTVGFIYTGSPDLRLMLVGGGCNEGTCLAFGEGRLIAPDLTPGDYFVVVDGADGMRGDFTLTPICENKVEPPVGDWTLGPGETIHETKTLSMTGDRIAGDIIFALDTTQTMGGALSNLGATATELLEYLDPILSDIQVGLVTFEDYPDRFTSCGYDNMLYGAIWDEPYRLDLALTPDRDAFATALGGVTIGTGSDLPESYTRVWHEMYTDGARIGWRAGAARIVIMLGDAEPHSCDTDACSIARLTTGIDPGIDGDTGTGDDLEIMAVMAELERQRIVPLFLETGGQPGLLSLWDCWTGAGAGRAYDAPGGNLPPTLATDIEQLIKTGSSRCGVLSVETTPGFEDWLTNVTPAAIADLALPARIDFDFDVGPPDMTPFGSYAFQVRFLCDDVVVAAQDVTIEVADCADPAGAIGNSLRAFKSGPSDVVLDWTGGPLSEQRYNIHRELSALDIDPPMSPPVADVVGAETHTDAAAVPAADDHYYEVYGRACDGSSIFN